MTNEECLANLADAKAAYHSLMTGTKARVIVDQNGQRVEFTSANATTLNVYIARLEAMCGCCVGNIAMPSGPAQFLF